MTVKIKPSTNINGVESLIETLGKNEYNLYD